MNIIGKFYHLSVVFQSYKYTNGMHIFNGFILFIDKSCNNSIKWMRAFNPVKKS